MNENVKNANKDKANKTKATKGNKRNNKPKISFIAILKKNLIKFRNWLREWEPIGVLIAIIALLVSIYLGNLQLTEWKADRELREKQFSEWQEERKARAWQILTTRAIGNSGKKEALEFLASQKTALWGIDLSCTTNNGKWDDKNKKCDPAGVYLKELDLSEKLLGHKVVLVISKFEGADLREARFDGAHLYRSRFDGAYLGSARFDGANLGYAKFYGAGLYDSRFDGAYLGSARFDGAILGYAKFDGAYLRGARFDGADLWNARFDGAYLEETDFSKAEKLEPKQLEYTWIWADYKKENLPILPIDWDKSAFDIILFCHPEIRDKYVDDIKEGKRKRGLPDPDKCKKWNEWPEENRKAWLEQP